MDAQELFTRDLSTTPSRDRRNAIREGDADPLAFCVGCYHALGICLVFWSVLGLILYIVFLLVTNG